MSKLVTWTITKRKFCTKWQLQKGKPNNYICLYISWELKTRIILKEIIVWKFYLSVSGLISSKSQESKYLPIYMTTFGHLFCYICSLINEVHELFVCSFLHYSFMNTEMHFTIFNYTLNYNNIHVHQLHNLGFNYRKLEEKNY